MTVASLQTAMQYLSCDHSMSQHTSQINISRTATSQWPLIWSVYGGGVELYHLYKGGQKINIIIKETNLNRSKRTRLLKFWGSPRVDPPMLWGQILSIFLMGIWIWKSWVFIPSLTLHWCFFICYCLCRAMYRLFRIFVLCIRNISTFEWNILP